MVKKPVLMLSREQLLSYEAQVREVRSRGIDKMDISADHAIAILHAATLYFEHLRKRGRSNVQLPIGMMAGLLTAAALNRNDGDAAKAFRRDSAVRVKKRAAKDQQRPDEFRQKTLTEVSDKLPPVVSVEE